MNAGLNTPAPFNLILSVGTQVVSRVDLQAAGGELLGIKGMVGVIVQAPTDGSHTYQVRLTNEQTVSLKRHEFSLRKQFQSEGMGRSPDLLAEYNLYDHVAA
jgi:uncharacterized protein